MSEIKTKLQLVLRASKERSIGLVLIVLFIGPILFTIWMNFGERAARITLGVLWTITAIPVIGAILLRYPLLLWERNRDSIRQIRTKEGVETLALIGLLIAVSLGLMFAVSR